MDPKFPADTEESKNYFQRFRHHKKPRNDSRVTTENIKSHISQTVEHYLCAWTHLLQPDSPEQ